jgi:hypothetical protein
MSKASGGEAATDEVVMSYETERFPQEGRANVKPHLVDGASTAWVTWGANRRVRVSETVRASATVGSGLGVLNRCHFARPLSSARLHLLSAQHEPSAQPLALRQPPAGQALCCPMGCDCRCSYRHPASWSANPTKGLLHHTQPVVFESTVNCHTVRVRGFCGWTVLPCAAYFTATGC